LATWLPATQHCQLEKLPGLSFLQCTTETPGNSSGCEGDSCDTVEKGLYKKSDNGDIAIPAILAEVLFEATAIAELPSPCTHELELISSPPRQRCESWEWYSSRALAIRGPSIPS
jgi:hypothetical protein